jgi:hypothetical protein
MAFTKKLILTLATVCWAVMVLELGSMAVYPLLGNGGYSRKSIREQLRIPVEDAAKEVAAEREPGFIKSHILHPYLGFVGTPGVDPELTLRGGHEVDINEAGFMGAWPVTRRSSGRVNICLLGGSVAMYFYLESRETLKRALQELGPFKGKDIVIVPLALGGYKQPQQLQALSYFLSEGAEYDLVINLDGFNEVALPFAENLPFGVYPSYPRLWHFYASRMLNVEGAVQFAALVAQTAKRRRLRETFANPLLSFSNFGLILWQVLDRRLEANIRLKTASLLKLGSDRGTQSKTRQFESQGPAIPQYSSQADFISKLADHWARSSMVMNHLATSAGAAYFHFLQPNQYLKNSKPLSHEEEAKAISPERDFPFRVGVELGYPILIAKGKDLAAKGIRFTNLTGVFQGNHATIYTDQCCHVNTEGNDLIAAKIAATIAEYYKTVKR